MKRPKDKKLNILLGITGGIAAYKSCELIRLFIKDGHKVKVILTENGAKFITPLTFETLSENKVYTDLFDKGSFSTEHISLSKWADLLLIAPATANIIGKYANGIADDMLSTALLSFTKSVFIAPAMHTEMYLNPLVSGNIAKLKNIGINFIAPSKGALASGDIGEGRLAEPKVIKDHCLSKILKKKLLSGKKVLITAGPTQEYIDPVRFISSPSSGKMGIALAKEAAEQGANVTLIHGPISMDDPLNFKTVAVTSAADMHKAVQKHKNCDIFISSAAVSDFKPDQKELQKIKGSRDIKDLKLKPNPDILKEFAYRHGKGKVLIGFAAETNDVKKNALSKIKGKKLDAIIANDVSKEGIGFGADHNKATFIQKNGKSIDLPTMSKDKLAESIIEMISHLKK